MRAVCAANLSRDPQFLPVLDQLAEGDPFTRDEEDTVEIQGLLKRFVYGRFPVREEADRARKAIRKGREFRGYGP